MAKLQVKDRSSVYTTARFLGLNESADGPSSIRDGEAARMENFRVTDNYHIRTRCGYKQLRAPVEDEEVSFIWSGYLGNVEMCIWAAGDTLYRFFQDGTSQVIATAPGMYFSGVCNAFDFDGALYIMTPPSGFYKYDGTTLSEVEGYIPTVLISCDPATGAGTEYEKINLLTKKRIATYNGNGSATTFKLLETAASVQSVKGPVIRSFDGSTQLSGQVVYAFTFDEAANTVTLLGAPPAGTNNVIIEYTADTAGGRNQVTRMQFAETYNGSTDCRVFLYGDGSNVALYSGITADGHATAEYFPSMNEVAVDDSNSPITGMIRHYSRLLAYKPDGVFTISYDAITTAEGETIAAFYVRPMNREIGNEMWGQVRQVYNYPRSFSHGSLYDWKQTSSFYRDERYAKIVSDRVQQTLLTANPRACVAYDDLRNHEYLLFLNDEAGTVLVHKYTLDVWYLYTGFSGVRSVERFGERMLLGMQDGRLLDWSEEFATDNGAEITSIWHSAFLDFGMDYMRKNAAEIWVALKPAADAEVEITATTDRRISNTVKTVASRLSTFSEVSFARFSFGTNRAPQVKRIKIKTKKFVFYQIKLRAVSRQSGTTVLGMDHKIRYTSQKK